MAPNGLVAQTALYDNNPDAGSLVF